MAQLRAARRDAKTLRPTLRQLRGFCRESHGDGYADPALGHARAAAARAGEREQGLLAAILAPRVQGSYLGGRWPTSGSASKPRSATPTTSSGSSVAAG